MFKPFIRTVALTAALASGAVAMTSAPAAADGIRFGFSIGTPYYEIERRHHRPAGFCAAQRAIHKARSIGVHRPRVVRENRRVLVVAGRSHGDRAVVRFAQRRDCPVISYRRR